jgi:nitrite reductase/ring-hydroxylating ferredoxin subunit
MFQLSISTKIKALLPLFLLLLSSCDSTKSTIPTEPVSLQVNLLQYTSLLSLGATMSFITSTTTTSLGFGGVLVVHTLDDTYAAFDLACPYEAVDTIRVAVQSDLTVKCSHCGSRYRITDGSGWVISGPSTQKLKSYSVYPSNNYLYVTN